MKLNNQEMMHWWQGYVVIEVRGKKLERLINRMMNHRFSAWHIIRTGEERAELSIKLTDFFKLRALLKETGCKSKVLERHGLPFFVQRVQRRIGLYSGILLFCFILYAASMMVWSVEIDGATTPETEMAIREELEGLGVKPGTFKFRTPDYQTIQREIMKLVPSTTWVGFRYEGTQAQLKVVEKTLPDVREPSGPRHLVATKKAIIHDLFVEQGKPVVKPNQYVQRGELLVSGYVGNEEQPQIVSATGRVLGEVWYEGHIELPMLQKKAFMTGEREKRYYFQLGSWAVPVWGWGKDTFEKYEADERNYSFTWRDWSFPLSWKVEMRQEVGYTEELKSEEETLELALILANAQLKQQIPADAVIKEENILRKRVENGKVYIKMHYTVIEEISSERPISTESKD
ncbi:sporulation protein YqfD [Bacillus horti]|uniref:Sporulation protein YqfD n=1 Tax=Caldalkalibacillus horti TaxID=77523 RepID=A0ABT9W4R3_9BACI|nr:sporulation protein YqfD [Bacillus horti]MDQ0168049.1 hypothetical protein [Bacillus horti]